MTHGTYLFWSKVAIDVNVCIDVDGDIGIGVDVDADLKADVDMNIITAAVGRFDRSRGRSIESIGSVGLVILRIFRFVCHVGELEICLVSKFQLCTTLGDRKNAETPKRKFSEVFGLVGSVFRSVRSILRLRVVVDPFKRPL